ELFHPVAGRGDPRFDDWVRQLGPVPPGRGTTMERLTQGERVVDIRDIAEDEGYQAGHPIRGALVEIGGFHSLLTIALRRDEALLGALHVYRREVRPFSKKEIAILES